ncbi:MAG: DUF4363 family protein [Firmicutes bacterium]|nr:DUF4363 family protein [Bacillota bacterium]
MIRLTIVLVIAAALIGMAIFEQHFIQGSYAKLEEKNEALIAIIQKQIDNNEDIDTEDNIKHVTDMYNWWLKKERQLSMLARHFDLAQVSDSLIYAKNFIAFNIEEEAMVGLLKIRYLIKTHSFNIGTSIQNVI